jgi:integrase
MAKREKGEGSLLERAGTDILYGQYYVNGKQVRFSTGETVRARAWEVLRKHMEAAHSRGVNLTDAKRITYRDLRAALLMTYNEKGNKSLLTRADGEETINGLPQLDEFMGFPKTDGPVLQRITTQLAREFVRKRQDDGAGNAVINRSLALLRRMLKIAADEHHVPVAKINLLKEPRARQGFLEPGKFRELLRELPTHLHSLMLLLFTTGVRIGEALQIEWRQVDLDRGLILLEEGQTKNDEPRKLPLTSELRMLLRQEPLKNGFVFTGTNLRKSWQQACAAVGLGTLTEVEGKPYDPVYKGLTIHDLRRSAVRNLTRPQRQGGAGVHDHVAMKISGHKNPNVFRRYNIVSDEDVLDAIQQLEVAEAKLLPGT